MIRRIFIYLCILFVLVCTLTSCITTTKEDSSEPIIKKLLLKEIADDKQIMYDYDKSNKLIGMLTMSKGKDSKFYSERIYYDDKGSIVKRNYYSDNKDYSIEYKNSYDENDNLILVGEEISKSDFYVYDDFEYDSKNRPLVVPSTDCGKYTGFWMEKEYDKKGNVIKETTYSYSNNNKTIDEVTYHEYDKKSNRIQTKTYNKSNVLLNSYTCEYEDNKLLSVTYNNLKTEFYV